jgi:hypothetical protein
MSRPFWRGPFVAGRPFWKGPYVAERDAPVEHDRLSVVYRFGHLLITSTSMQLYFNPRS